MKISNKILITILPIILFTVMIVNQFFGTFFNDYLIGQEISQIEGNYNKISQYITQSEEKHLSTAKDWGHWDDTYDFIRNLDEDYIINNLKTDDLATLNASFMLFF